MRLNEPSITALTQSLRSERASVSALIEALTAEAELLSAGGTDALADIAARKRELLLHIAHLGDHRNRMLERSGVRPDRQGMQSLITANPEAHGLRSEWNGLIESAQVAHRLNQQNGIYIEASMRSTQQALSVLVSAAKGGTYGRTGRTLNPLGSRTLAAA